MDAPEQPPFDLVMLDHVVIRCADIDRMLAFYQTVVGCTLERTVEDLGLFQLRAGSSLIDLVAADGKLGQLAGGPPDRTRPNMDHLCLQVEPWDEDAIIRHLGDHDVEVDAVGTRYGARGNGPSIYVTDPEGNTVELKGPPTDPA